MTVDKRNIFLTNTVQAMPYVSGPQWGGASYPKRNSESHARYIQRKLADSYKAAATQKRATAIRYKEGVYIEFIGAPEHDLATKSLENRAQGIRLLNVREDDGTNTIRATVYIPAGKETYFIKKIEDYATKLTPKGNPRNNDLVSSIEDIKLAVLESFWTGDKVAIPTSSPAWCEIWLHYDYISDNPNSWEPVETSFKESCEQYQIKVDENRIIFPERIVKSVFADANQLKLLIGLSPYIAEIRQAQEPPTFFRELPGREQLEWTEELLSRTNFQNLGVSVCLLDTGITSAHPLLNKAIGESDMLAVKSRWRIGDHQGHGTEMAGLVLYKDLRLALESTNEIFIPHRLESVKILPPKGANPYELYGAITQQAVSLAEISNPNTKRILCMAVTSASNNTGDGSPTSWSAAIDTITSAADEEGEGRLFFISAGNILPNELSTINDYPALNTVHSVQSPGQSWNAITVGAYSQSISICDPVYKGYFPVADVGELSPYSSTSGIWNARWPIKPEILFDGGNMVSNGTDFSECGDLSLLTTSHISLYQQFSTICGTSAATAQAAWMGAQLSAVYPYAWPETIRALIIHSATWTDKMKEQFCIDDMKTKGRRLLLRTCGYGIPNLEKAIQCMNNSVNLVIQDEMQPYKKNSMNEMHLHRLPWPNEQLRSLGQVPVTLKVTLSYFIEPGPGEIGWKDKYRYPSCGLRFDVINANETPNDFKKRVNIKMRGEDKKDRGEGTSGSERWYLGSENRDVGSIHSDFCELSAVDLCDCNFVAIYPVIGWWRERSYLGKHDNTIRYSVIISLSTPKIDVDLYTPIVTEIKNTVGTSIKAF